MKDIILGYILCFLCVFGIIGTVTLLHKILKFSGELSRKLIHILVGLTWLPMYFYLRGTVHIIIVPVIFTVVNWLSAYFGIFKSMERDRGDGKHDFGTVYFAVCMVILSVISYFFPNTLYAYGIAVYCLSFGDGAAAIFGTLIKSHNPTIMKGKSLLGTLSCAVFAVLGVYFACAFTNVSVSPVQALILGVATAILELFGGRLDNFTVSFGVMLCACILI
ncbi:MAG: hypothetical protein IJO93_00695 [Clostridia bacterium]|nr:hypothetical protein [Clostridia bacterium]